MALSREDRDAIVGAIQEGFKSSGGGGGGGTPGNAGTDFGKTIAKNVGEGFTGILDVMLNKAGGTLADNTGKISKKAQQFVNYIESTNSVFQSLSKVGGGLNADFSDLRMSSAMTRLPLEQFANLIGQNSRELAGFSGGVSAGAKRFSELSKSMFEEGQLINGFMNLGMTIEESNEFLMENMQLDRRRRRLENMTNREQVESALELARTMDVMAKLTGKSVKEQQDQLKDRMREGATQAKLRLLEMDGVTGASQSYKQAQASLAGAPKVVGDLLADLVQTGVPMTEATKNFAATNKEAYALLQQSAAATKRGDAVEAERLAKEAAAATASFANSRQGLTIATLAQVSDIAQGQADRLEEMGAVIDAMAEHNTKIAKGLGDTADYIDTFNDMLKSITSRQTQQMAGTGAFQGAQQSIQQGQLGLANSSSDLVKTIGGAMGAQENQGILEGFTKSVVAIGDIATGLTTMLTSLGLTTDKVSPALTGSELINEGIATPKQKDDLLAQWKEAGLIDNDGLKTVIMKDMVREKLLEAIKESKKDDGSNTEVGGPVDAFLRLLNLRAVGGPVIPGMNYLVGEKGPEIFSPNESGQIVPNLKSMLNVRAMADLKEQMQLTGVPMTEAAKKAAAEMQKTGSIEEKLDILNQTMLQLVGINNMQTQIGNKQIKTMRSSMGNLMTGIGRV